MMIFFRIIAFVALCLLSGLLYRLGGIGKPWNTKWRDFGVPVVALAAMLVLGIGASWGLWWLHLISAVLLFGSLTTYWEHWGSDDVEWYEWLATGFVYSLAYLPYVWYLDLWIPFLIRTIVLALLTMAWSEVIDDVDWEERGRGFLIVISLPLLNL
jgi:hypothetical protein